MRNDRVPGGTGVLRQAAGTAYGVRLDDHWFLPCYADVGAGGYRAHMAAVSWCRLRLTTGARGV
jgi:hypothetical protein